MVELRKRPAPKETPAPPAKRSASKPRTSKATATSKVGQVVEKAKELVTGESSTTATADADADTSATTTAVDTTGGVDDAGVTTEAPPAVTAARDKKEKEKESEVSLPMAETAPEMTSAKAKKKVASATATANATSPSLATTPLSTESTNKSLPPSALSTPTLSHTGTKSTLGSLLTSSTKGIIIFTYPKASTPGCTTQACLFRDNYTGLSSAGYTVYGLSNDSEKANTGFKTKQKLQYEMLCDPGAELTGILGMKKSGNQKGTLRGVVVLEKDEEKEGGGGGVKVWFQGGPAKTVEVVGEALGVDVKLGK